MNAPSTEASVIRLAPARSTVFPLPKMSQAMPRRGDSSPQPALYSGPNDVPGPTC